MSSLDWTLTVALIALVIVAELTLWRLGRRLKQFHAKDHEHLLDIIDHLYALSMSEHTDRCSTCKAAQEIYYRRS